MTDYEPVDIGNVCNAGPSLLGDEQVETGPQSIVGLPFLIGGSDAGEQLLRRGERLQRCRNRTRTRGGPRSGVRPPAVEVRGVQGRPFGHRRCRVRLSLRRRLGGAGADQGAVRNRVHSRQGRHPRRPRHPVPCRPGPGPRAVCPLRRSVGGGWPAPDRGGQCRREAVLPLVMGQPPPGQDHRGDRACTEGASVHGGRNHAAARR